MSNAFEQRIENAFKKGGADKIKKEPDKIETKDLSEDEQAQIARLEEVIDMMFADKQEIREVYAKIKDYLPAGAKRIAPEAVWEKLRQSKWRPRPTSRLGKKRKAWKTPKPRRKSKRNSTKRK